MVDIPTVWDGGQDPLGTRFIRTYYSLAGNAATEADVAAEFHLGLIARGEAKRGDPRLGRPW